MVFCNLALHFTIFCDDTVQFGMHVSATRGPYGGRERSVQGAGGETRGEETAGETKA